MERFDRRNFMNQLTTGAAFAGLMPILLNPSLAMAQVAAPGNFKDVPGFGGKLKAMPLNTIKHDPVGDLSRSNLLWVEAGLALPQHEHPGGELIYIIDGSAIIDSTYEDGRTESVRYTKGDVMWFPPHTFHTQEISESVLAFVYEPLPADFTRKSP